MTDDSRIIKLGEHTPRSRKNQMDGPATKKEILEWGKAWSVAIMQKVYAQLADENAKMFQQLEDLVTQRVLHELERRTVRGKAIALWRRVRGKPALKAMDARTLALGMLKDRLAAATEGDVVELPWGTTPADADAIAKAQGTSAAGVTT